MSEKKLNLRGYEWAEEIARMEYVPDFDEAVDFIAQQSPGSPLGKVESLANRLRQYCYDHAEPKERAWLLMG